MFKPITLSEKLLFSTVRIEAQTSSGLALGTGFFFSFKLDADRQIQVILTNKHVINGSRQGSFFLHHATGPSNELPSGEFFRIEADKDFEQQWMGHPDPNVDLCAYCVQPTINNIKDQGESVFFTSITEDLIWPDCKLEQLRAVEDVLMIGYPTGLWDSKNNLPLIRKGITASHPAVDFCGQGLGVIDMACFGGSSGSPVLIVNEGSYSIKPEAPGGSMPLVSGTRGLLLGVLSSGPTMTAEGSIVVRPIPTSATRAVIETQLMIHLGYYVKAKEILELKKHIIHTLKEQGRLG